MTKKVPSTPRSISRLKHVTRCVIESSLSHPFSPSLSLLSIPRRCGIRRVTALLACQVSDGDTVALTVRDGRLELAPLVDAEPVEEELEAS